MDETQAGMCRNIFPQCLYLALLLLLRLRISITCDGLVADVTHGTEYIRKTLTKLYAEGRCRSLPLGDLELSKAIGLRARRV